MRKIVATSGYQHPFLDGEDQKPFPAYAYFVVLYKFFACLSPYCNEEGQSEWREKLSELLKTCPLEVHSHMGFPQEWETLPFWKK